MSAAFKRELPTNAQNSPLGITKVRWRFPWLVGLAAMMVVVAFIPLRSVQCPAWDVLVTDENGHPLSGITVRLTYQNYSAETKSHEIDAVTDAEGHAAFVAQTVVASIAARVAAIALAATAGP